MSEESKVQVKKISAAGLGGVVGIVLIYTIEVLVNFYHPELEPDFAIPGMVASAIGTLCGYIASLLLPDEREE